MTTAAVLYPRSRHRLAAAAGGVAVVLAVTGCAHHAAAPGPGSAASPWTAAVPTSPAARPPTATPTAFAGVDHSSADAVAAAVIAVWFAWDTTRDSGPYDATARAIPLLDPMLAEKLMAYPPKEGPGADWLALAAAGALAHVSSAAAAESGGPADTADTDYLLRTVTQTFTGHPAPPPRQLVVALVVRREFDGWRVASLVTR